MLDDIDHLLDDAITLHEERKFFLAAVKYLKILEQDALHADTNHNFGLLKVELGLEEEALIFLQTAINTNPNVLQYWVTFINTLTNVERFDDAGSVLEQAHLFGHKDKTLNHLRHNLDLAQRKYGTLIKPNQLDASKKINAEADYESSKKKEQRTSHVSQLDTSIEDSDKHQTNILDEMKLDKALKLAKRDVIDGLSEEAKKIYQDILVKFPKNKRALDGLKGLAGVLIGSDKVSEVQDPTHGQQQSIINLYRRGQLKKLLQQASLLLQQFPNSSFLYNISGAAYKGLDQLDAAIEAYNKAISLSPNYTQAYNNMGIALQDQGKLEEAIEAYKIAISINPDYADAYNNMGNVHRDQRKLDEAKQAYNKAISVKPDFSEAYNNVGIVLKEQGKPQEAIEAYSKAVSINPKYAHAHNNMGNALADLSKLEEAVDAYSKAVSINPEYPEAHNNMGIALQDQGKLEEAIEAYSKATYINPEYTEAYLNIGNVLKEQGKLDEAVEAYSKAVSINPKYAHAHNNMGIALQDQGKLEEAIETYKKALSINPTYAKAHRNLVSIKKYNPDDKHLFQVKKLYGQKGLSENDKCQLSFALAKMYEDIGELHQSYGHLSEGNRLRKKLLKYSINQDQELFTDLKRTQPQLLKNSLKINEKSTEATPIFILGMPRSGTTLVEQIISSHSKVRGAGELNHVSQLGLNLSVDPKAINIASISEFRDRYLSELSIVSDGKLFVTDKMPGNFCFIPLICAAFPEAKIVHVERNAIATCWSNFKQYFVSNGLGYCYDLKDLVAYYSLYTEMMRLWQAEYSDQIYNLNYENLTTDQENQTRKLIKYLGLNWQDSCLSPQKNKRSVRTASQQQVRQKVYQGSSEAWRKYEPYLKGAFDSLKSK